MMLREFFLVGVGGAIGSILRYSCSLIIKTNGFPYPTLFVNVAGSFLIGMLFALTEKNPGFLPWKSLAAIGFCGGFTTFSAFSSESLEFLKQEQYFLLTIYISLSLTLGILAVWAGHQLLK
jgi:CrcB protein